MTTISGRFVIGADDNPDAQAASAHSRQRERDFDLADVYLRRNDAKTPARFGDQPRKRAWPPVRRGRVGRNDLQPNSPDLAQIGVLDSADVDAGIAKVVG
jgi:hypothetical protein